jgi:CMP/dCMP kinase
MSLPFIIAVDGPAAAGKGTLARRLAQHLGLPYLDTGLLYRAVGRRVLDAGADPADPIAAVTAATALTPEDMDRLNLRGPEADAAASKVAAIPAVRAALLDFQRRFGAVRGAVLDGRDIGTVVFPEARVKLFVTARPEVRARRRYAELLARGVAPTLGQVAKDMADRDARDANRGVAPLRPAEDARLLDTSDLDADAVFEAALALVAAMQKATSAAS